jgi:hypothetical protein
MQVLLFAEELASVVLTPFILAFSLPNCAGELSPTAAAGLGCRLTLCFSGASDMHIRPSMC